MTPIAVSSVIAISPAADLELVKRYWAAQWSVFPPCHDRRPGVGKTALRAILRHNSGYRRDQAVTLPSRRLSRANAIRAHRKKVIVMSTVSRPWAPKLVESHAE